MAQVKQTEIKTIDAVLLRDSALGKVGDVVILTIEEAKVYEENGFIDTHKDAVKHAKG